MKKILIVEDEKNILLTLKILLKNKGYDVFIAEDGISAIEEAQKNLPNLILLDILIPKMNGYIVCEALKQEDATKAIPIIFMSAKTQQEDIKKAYEVGGKDYITKPFTNERIIEVVSKYIEVKNIEEE